MRKKRGELKMKNKGLIAAVIVIFGFLLAAFGYQMGAKQTGESAEQPTDQTAKKRTQNGGYSTICQS